MVFLEVHPSTRQGGQLLTGGRRGQKHFRSRSVASLDPGPCMPPRKKTPHLADTVTMGLSRVVMPKKQERRARVCVCVEAYRCGERKGKLKESPNLSDPTPSRTDPCALLPWLPPASSPPFRLPTPLRGPVGPMGEAGEEKREEGAEACPCRKRRVRGAGSGCGSRRVCMCGNREAGSRRAPSLLIRPGRVCEL